jgi:hypothetical protein
MALVLVLVVIALALLGKALVPTQPLNLPSQ